MTHQPCQKASFVRGLTEKRKPGETADSLGLTGRERYTVVIPPQLTPRMVVDIKVGLDIMLT